MSRLKLKQREVANFGDIGLPETMFARTRLCLEFSTVVWEWFCIYRYSGKEEELKKNLKTLEEKYQMSKTMMLPPCLLTPYTDTVEAIKAIETLTAPAKESKSAKQRIQEQHALATLYDRIREGMDSTKAEIKRQAGRKYQNKLKGTDKRTIKEYMYESLRLVDKICEEAGIRHLKAVESHYQIRLVNVIATYDEAMIAAEIKEALPVADEFESVREALDAAAVILRTMAEYRDEFADWAPPSKDRLKSLRDHKEVVAGEDAQGEEAKRKVEAASQSDQSLQKGPKNKEKELLKLPPISPKQGGAGNEQNNVSLGKDIEQESLGERYEREINNLKEQLKKTTFEYNASQGQLRFLYANLTQEKKAMLRTAYDFELPPEKMEDDEENEEDNEETKSRSKLGINVGDVKARNKKELEKRSLTMLHTTLEKHQRKINEMLKKSKKLGGTIVLYDEYGNSFIHDVNLTKRLVDPREIKPKKKKDAGKSPTSSRSKSRKDALPPSIVQPGEYVMVTSMILHLDWDPEKHRKSDSLSFTEQYLRDACHLHRELAFTNPIGLAASLRYAADLCMRSRDFPAALGLYEKVVDIRRRKMGEHDPEVAQSIEYLGEIHAQMGQFDKALLLQEEALNMRLNIYGNSHIDVAQNLRAIATLQAMHGDFDEAVTLFTRSLNILLKNFHKTHPQVEMVKVQLQMARQQKKEELRHLQKEVHQNTLEGKGLENERIPGDDYDERIRKQSKAETEAAEPEDSDSA